MIEIILGFFENLFGSHYFGWIAAVFLLSMLPGIGGPMTTIPLGFALGLPVATSALICIVGNIIPVPFIVLFIRYVFRWMRRNSVRLGKVADRFEEKAKAKGARFHRGMFIGLLIFVAIPIPLPGMGAWTGALIAAISNIRIRIALPAIGIGVIIAAIITSVVTYGLISLVR